MSPGDRSAIDWKLLFFIADETGGLVAEMGRTEEGIITASFDLDAIARARTSWGLFRDRRPELYSVIGGHDGR